MASTPPPEPEPPRRSLAWTWLRGALLLVPALVLVELVVRFFVASPRAMIGDDELVFVHVPSTSVVFSEEGYSRGYANAEGLLDAPREEEPSGAPILAVGDSYTEARQVPPELRFTELAQAELGVAVINAGHSSWTLGHHANFVRRRCARYAPRAIVVQLNDGDALELTGAGVDIAPEADGYALRVAPPPRSRSSLLVEAVARRSALFNMAQSRASLLLSRQLGRGDGAPAAEREPPEDLEARVAWALGDIGRCAPVLVLYIPRLDYRGARCGPQFPEMPARYATAARTAGAAFVDVGDAFCAAYARDRQPPHGFHNARMGAGHPNARGHRLVARALVDALRRLEVAR